MNSLTKEEKQFILELIGKLSFGINGIEQAQFARGIALKLQQLTVDNEEKK